MIRAATLMCVAYLLADCWRPGLSVDEDFSDLYDNIIVVEHSLKTKTFPAGANATLACRCHHDRNIVWQFLPCRRVSGEYACDDIRNVMRASANGRNVSWRTLEVAPYAKKCQLELSNLQPENSGLYRCTNNTTLLRTFEIDVKGPIAKDEEIPHIININPTNSTILLNCHLIIQCKVFSLSPPNIWWFKQSDTITEIKYDNKYYYRINTTDQLYEVPGEPNIYLSKLNIYNAREIDSGTYVCAAITNGGLAPESAVVRVVSNSAVYWKPNASFSLLFLIPLAFALIPIIVWLVYYRKKKNSPVEALEERKFIRRVNNNENVRVPVV